jgi:hypothetical protein
MNQQRSRRFRSAQEAALKEVERQKAIAEWEGQTFFAFLWTCFGVADTDGSYGQADERRVQERKGLGSKRHYAR